DFSEWQRALDAAFEVPLRGFWKCCYVPALTQSQVDHVVDAAERLPTPQSSILIEHLHGAFGDTTEDTSAFPLRHARFGVLFSSRWRERELDAHCMGWARGGVANCDPAETAGAYSNYSFDGEARVARDLGRARIGSRLLRAKASYDPNNLLRLNHLGRSLASAVQR
ncbi:MAG TPA: hypothetical protein VMG12_13055, partial [Polyangiaceae bacterium]|nr:hypothetical protein [Polyangiaceae bacterium]